jgi:hypothetical protein
MAYTSKYDDDDDDDDDDVERHFTFLPMDLYCGSYPQSREAESLTIFLIVMAL